MRFVHCSLKEKRCFGVTKLNEIFVWVDASYAVHHDMKSHTGVVMSIVLGITHCILRKKILNTKISTEVELDGASDYQTYNIW